MHRNKDGLPEEYEDVMRSLVKESVPDPFADGSEENPTGMFPVDHFSEAKIRRMLRHYWKESKRARRTDYKRAINGWINILLGYLRVLEQKAGVEKLTPLERRARESELITDLLEKEIKKKDQTIMVLRTVISNSTEILKNLKSNPKLYDRRIEELVALRTLHNIAKKDCPEENVRRILRQHGLPEDRVKRMASGYKLR